MKKFFAIIVAMFVSTSADAITCNDPSGFIKSFGPINTGNTLILGPDCQHAQDGGPPGGLTAGQGLFISGATLNAPYIIPQGFNASGSGQSTTGSMTGGGAALTLAAALDFANNQGIRVNRAGAATTAAPPSALLVTQSGTPGATAYAYTVASLDSQGGVQAVIANTATATGNAALSGTNFNVLNWTAGAGASAYAIYGNKAGSLTLIGITAALTFSDFGVGAITPPDWIPQLPPAVALSRWLITTIVSGGGSTSLTLAAPASGNVASQTVIHDDTVAFQNAINSAQNTGYTLFVPVGSYQLTSTLGISAGMSLRGRGYIGDSGQNYIGGSLSYNSAANITKTSGWLGSTVVCHILLTCFFISTADAIDFRDMQLVYPIRVLSGATAIVGNIPGVPPNTFSTFRDNFISGSDAGISLTNWLNFTLDHNTIAPWTTSVLLSVPAYPSFGDSTINSNVMFGRNVAQHIFLTSYGGLRIVNNKLVSGTVGIYIQTNLVGDNIEPMVINDNSIEGQVVGIQFQRGGGSTSQASQLTINGNQLYVGTIGINFLTTAGANWITGWTINGNSITTLAASAVGFQADGASVGNVSGNSFIGGGTAVGYNFTANTSQITVAANIFYNGMAAAGTNASATNFISIAGCLPTVSAFTTGTDQTYTVPKCQGAPASYLEIELIGGGGAGKGSGTTPGAGTAATSTCFNTGTPACTTPMLAGGNGIEGTASAGSSVAGGTVTGSLTCDIAIAGATVGGPSNQVNSFGSIGGAGPWGGAGGTGFASTGFNAAVNSGAGGGGAGDTGTGSTGGGGSAGGYCKKLIAVAAATYRYTIGSGGVHGTAGTGGFIGGDGAAGRMNITARWN